MWSTVYVDHRDLNRLAKLWRLVDRIEKLNYSIGPSQLAPFLSSLGPAPNLKVLCIRPNFGLGIKWKPPIHIPAIFSGGLPTLRVLNLKDFPISPAHVLDALRESPSIESLRLEGHCTLPQGFHPPTVTLPSLEECALVGRGTASLIRFLTVPVSARVFLSKPYNDGTIFPNFYHISVAPNLRVLEGVSTISSRISDDVIRLHVKNYRGGDLDAEVYGLYDLSRDPVIFSHFIRSSFDCGRTCLGFKTTKVFTLDVYRDCMWEPEDATCFALDVMGFIFNLPSIEEVTLRGVLSLELSSILKLLHSAENFELPCPNLKRLGLDIESTPIRSPRRLLLKLGKLLSERRKQERLSNP